jgi:HWE histidine kinase
MTEPHLCAMADINAIDPQGPAETPELIPAAQDKAIRLWQDIELRLRTLAVEELAHRLKNKIASIQSIISYQLREQPRLRDDIKADCAVWSWRLRVLGTWLFPVKGGKSTSPSPKRRRPRAAVGGS